LGAAGLYDGYIAGQPGDFRFSVGWLAALSDKRTGGEQGNRPAKRLPKAGAKR
jgi:hypothetical protein